MQRLLIPLFVFVAFCMPAVLLAQIPQEISVPPGPFKYPKEQAVSSPDMMCNNAGTYTYVQFFGNSNDTSLPQIFLCANDSFQLRFNGDADLSGDPQPGTPPGLAFGFYECPPTIMGDNLQAIGAIPGPGDPCVLNVPPSANGLYITPGTGINGTTSFFNSGSLISTFGLGQPVSIFYAPITLDEIIPPAGFESAVVGSPPGPCVNVNISQAFEVIYLNPITQQGIVNNYFGNDCLGKFNIRGGYPEYDGAGIYTINIYLTSNPSVKAVIHTPKSQMFHNAPIIFSVTQAGNYTIEVEDGKSCPGVFTMDMASCVSADNIVLNFPDTIASPGATNFCVPLTVENFDITSGQFSINWDPSVLQFTSLDQVNPVLAPPPNDFINLNISNTSLGELGLVVFDNVTVGNVLSIPDGEAAFNVCFNVVGSLGQCSGLTIANSPTGIGFEDAVGQPLALTSDTGSVCVGFMPLSFTAEVIDTTCLGLATLKVTAFGGDVNSQYQVIVEDLTSGVTYNGNIIGAGSMITFVDILGNFNNLSTMYSICVTDSNGIGTTVCDTITVLIETLGAQIDFIQQPTCNGFGDGIVDAVVLFGGLPVANPGANYTYQWTSTAGGLVDPTVKFQDGTVNNDIRAASYTLVVTDLNTMCSASASGSLGQPTRINDLNIVMTQASCSGVANGMIEYEVTGGTPFPGNQYQFAWSDVNGPVGAPGQNNPIVINNLAAGTYTVTLTDANGCTAVDSVAVTDNRVVDLTEGQIQNVSCFGLSDGVASVTVTESIISGHSYQFTWNPAIGSLVNTNLSSVNSGLPADTFFVTAVDQIDGCMDTISVVVTQPALLVLDTLDVQGPGCGAPNSGTINMFAQGGTGGPNYSYLWSDGTTGCCRGGLPVGMYAVTVTDANGCQDSSMIELFPPVPPPVNITVTPEKCGDDGVLIVVSPGAVTFNWEAVPSTGQLSATDTLSNLSGGTYAVTVTDGLGCTGVGNITLLDVVPLNIIDTSFVEPLCYGDDNGIVGIVVQDGQPPYVNYEWTPGPSVNGPTLFGLTAGDYTVTVTDNVGCTLTGTFTLNQPPEIVNNLSGITDVSCFGICDGTATVMAEYATSPNPTPGNFVYLWSDGNSVDSMRTDLCSGMYIITSADNNSCGDTDTLFIGSPPEVCGTYNATQTSCFGVADGSATIMGCGGNGGPYTYVWSDPGGTTGPTANNLLAGEYVVTVTDANGCTSVVDSVFVTEPAEIVVTQDDNNTTQPHCFGDSEGAIAVLVNGGNTGQFTYEWFDDMGSIGTTVDVAEFVEIPAGFYSVIVTDPQGCTGTLVDIMLQDPPPVLGAYQQPEALTCYGDVTTLNIESISGGSGGPYQFSLDYGALLDINFPVTLTGGQHVITYFDVEGCFYEDTINVIEPAPFEVSFNSPIIEIELGDTLTQLKPLISGSAVASFMWTPAELLTNPDSINPYIHTFDSQLYTLTVEDDNGCSATGSIQVNVDPNRNVYVPNVFKPGIGGLNDHFNVYVGRGVDIVNYMRVYDRWGELVYSRDKFLPENDNTGDGWDGKFRGDFVDPAVFVYIIEVKFLDGRVLLYRGDVTVVR
ncbi:MAG: gliding motility-associated C-terminal domain-containing protein [Saprospiraceae bacterium]